MSIGALTLAILLLAGSAWADPESWRHSKSTVTDEAKRYSGVSAIAISVPSFDLDSAVRTDISPVRPYSPLPQKNQRALPPAIAIGSIGQFQSFLINHADWAASERLLADPRFSRVEATLRIPLKDEGVGLRSKRERMLPEGISLDQNEESLMTEGQLRESERAVFDGELADLNNQTSDQNRNCASPPNEAARQACIKNKASLDKWKGDYNLRINAFNLLVHDRNRRVLAHHAIWDVFVEKLQEWDAMVSAFLEKMTNALVPAGDCTEELKSSVHKICDKDRRCTGEHTCKELRPRFANGLACEAVRKKVMSVCPDDTERDHPGQLRETQEALEKCRYWIGRTCGAGVQAQPGTR